MSDPRLDSLSDMARNRGLKLVRSRVRTPGKRRFGRAGLSDGSGKAVFGMDAKGPVATPEAVETYLRGLEAEDWGASLKIAGASPKTKAKAGTSATAAARPKGAAPVSPAPPRKPEVRKAKPSDVARLVELISQLGHEITEQQVRRNLAALTKSGDTPLVAVVGDRVVGLCGVGRRVAIHRQTPLGRITALVVDRKMQGEGIGRLLVDAAERWMRKNGCTLAEVTSNDRRTQAHAFYRHLGYERTSLRFAKTL